MTSESVPVTQLTPQLSSSRWRISAALMTLPLCPSASSTRGLLETIGCAFSGLLEPVVE